MTSKGRARRRGGRVLHRARIGSSVSKVSAAPLRDPDTGGILERHGTAVARAVPSGAGHTRRGGGRHAHGPVLTGEARPRDPAGCRTVAGGVARRRHHPHRAHQMRTAQATRGFSTAWNSMLIPRATLVGSIDGPLIDAAPMENVFGAQAAAQRSRHRTRTASRGTLGWLVSDPPFGALGSARVRRKGR